MPQVSLVDVASYLPGEPVPTDYFTQFSRSERMAKNVMFRSPTGRHHVGRDETAVDMVERAFARCANATAPISPPRSTSAHPHPTARQSGARRGPEWRDGSGLKPSQVLDVHNGGCAAFVHMMAMARMMMATSDAKTALIVAAQNCCGPGVHPARYPETGAGAGAG